MRAFAKKKSSKKGAASEEVTEEEPVEDAAEPVAEPVKAAPVKKAAPVTPVAVEQSLYVPFSVGDIK